MKNRILYIEDMKRCYHLTKESLSPKSELRWIRKITPAFDKIEKYLTSYDKVIVDVNLDISNPETEEGLEIIKRLRKMSKDLSIICVSSEDKKIESLQSGANEFIFKKQFWKNER